MGQGVLEGVLEVREEPGLVHELGGLQGREPAPQRVLGDFCDGLQDGERHVLPDDRRPPGAAAGPRAGAGRFERPGRPRPSPALESCRSAEPGDALPARHPGRPVSTSVCTVSSRKNGFPSVRSMRSAVRRWRPGIVAEERSEELAGAARATTGPGAVACRTSCCPSRAGTRDGSQPGGASPQPAGGSRRGGPGAPAFRSPPSRRSSTTSRTGWTRASRSQSRLIASSVRWRRCCRVQHLPGTVMNGHVEQSEERGEGGPRARSSARSLGHHLLANLGRVVAVLERRSTLLRRSITGRYGMSSAIQDRGAVCDERALVAMRPHDLPDQPRLADARLPDDGHDLAVAGGRPGQRVAQLLHLGAPPTRGSSGPRGARPGRSSPSSR